MIFIRFFQKNKTNNSESTAWYAVAAKNDYDYYSNYLSGFLEFLNKSFIKNTGHTDYGNDMISIFIINYDEH